MTVTLNLPDELASRLTTLLPEGTRDRFAAAAIAAALNLRQLETEDCVSIVEEALADMDAGRNLVSFEEVYSQWELDKAARKMNQPDANSEKPVERRSHDLHLYT